ncbi:MAG TPA: serine hydrolase domain-containing protein [Thermoguttaceae bacterium]|nr:serine hydrolase domain-containing protein [Thermoguttaceae bacterium]
MRSSQNLVRLVLSASLFVTVFPIYAQSIDTAAVDAIVEDARKAWAVPGAAVAIVKDGKVVHLKGYGVKEQGKSDPVTPDTIFNIGSTGKSFTALAVAVLADEGRLNWDDPVRKHLSYFRLADPEADRLVTLRDLATHRVGLARNDDLWQNSPPLSREEIIRRVGRLPLEKPFRSTFLYNNLMYLTLGCAAGAADGGSWERVVQERVFDRLGMKSANFSHAVAERSPDHSSPHVKEGARIKAKPWRNLDNIGPAGSINASARDLSQWLRFQLGDGTIDGKRVLSGAALAETHKPQIATPSEGKTRKIFPYAENTAYCLGWNSHTNRGHLILWHGGGGPTGFRTQILLVPKSKLGIAVVSNVEGVPQLPEPVVNGILDLALGFPKRDWSKAILDALK